MIRSGTRLRLADDAAERLAALFDAIRADLEIPATFPEEVLQAAAATRPEPAEGNLTGVEFITVDPPGSTDLDQAMALSRRDGGFHVDYAIADVPAFVDPAGPVAAEAMRRGQTLYAPDTRTPLHPVVISEAAASLLPDVERQAYVWRFDLDDAGEVTGLDLVRARVRSRRRLDYEGIQAAAGGAPADDLVSGQAGLLREIGELRLGLERARGGASLPLPEQEVSRADGRYQVEFRPPLPAEDWNAQLSLMTGMAAARLMLDAGIGVLRTMPAPDPDAVAYLRRRARALGVDWPQEQAYGAFIRTLDPADAGQLALLHAAGSLFRGAGYTPFDGAPPEQPVHAAVAAPYAHVTAPLRRLVDRFGLVASHAAHGGIAAPDWVRAGLPELPAVMATSDRLAGDFERRCLDTVEAAVLADRVGEQFSAVVVESARNGDGGRVQVTEPAVLAKCDGRLELGESIRVRLVTADPDAGTVRFARL